MSNNGEKMTTNFLAAGISNAVPPKSMTPPPPPRVRRPKERTEETQDRENANSQIRKDVTTQPYEQAKMQPEPVLEPASENITTGIMTDEQVRLLAQMLQNATANSHNEKKAKRRKIDLAELLIQTIANVEGSENIKEQFSKLANSQKTKINQGIYAPEALFTIYRNASVQLGLAGQKVSMGDLMAKALIAYLPHIIQDLGDQE